MSHSLTATDDLPKVTGDGCTNRGLMPPTKYWRGGMQIRAHRFDYPVAIGTTFWLHVEPPCRSASLASLAGCVPDPHSGETLQEATSKSSCTREARGLTATA